MADVPVTPDWDNIELVHLDTYHLRPLKAFFDAQFPIKYDKRYFRELLSDDNHVCVIAIAAHEIVGAACLRLHHDSSYTWSMSRVSTAYLMNIAVNEKYRRRKLAWRMIDALLAVVTATGRHNIIKLHCLTDNSAAIALYHRLGFTISQHMPNHYHFGQRFHDALEMTALLTTVVDIVAQQQQHASCADPVLAPLSTAVTPATHSGAHREAALDEARHNRTQHNFHHTDQHNFHHTDQQNFHHTDQQNFHHTDQQNSHKPSLLRQALHLVFRTWYAIAEWTVVRVVGAGAAGTAVEADGTAVEAESIRGEMVEV